MAIKKYHESKNLLQNGEFENTAVDTMEILRMNLRLLKDGVSIASNLVSVSATGYFSITLSSDNVTDSFNVIRIQHSGQTANILIQNIICDYPSGTPITFSAICDDNDPTTVGGIKLQQMMVNVGGTPLPYEPYFTPYFSDEPYREFGTETESITTFPKEIITDGEPIGINLLNPDSTFIESGNTYYGGTFPAGTYYIMNNDSLYDYIEVIITELGSTEVTSMAGGASDIFTTTGTITVKIWTQNTARNVLVARSSVAVPFVPYLPCTISGNLVQTGTPTPSDPIYPQECGEMTENLFNVTTVEKGRINDGDVVYQSDTTSLTIEGDTVTYTTNARYRGVCSDFIEIPDGAEYLCWSGVFSGGDGIAKRIIYYNSTKTWLDADSSTPSSENSGRQQIPVNAKYVRFSFTSQGIGEASISNMMVSAGYNALPYEPYGMYKLPIVCGGVTTNTYLGETQSTRKIKKLVFDGTEDWEIITNNNPYFRLIGRTGDGTYSIVVCSHLVSPSTSISANNTTVGVRVQSTTDYGYVIILRTPTWQTDTLSDFKSFLAQQYDAGTPVTIWYVLNTPETTTLNEPIRKIRDYADTVSATNIPTTGTAEQFDIQTTLKPSEVSLTYHGWHEHTNTKYTE